MKTSDSDQWVIVVAGGSGSRMQSEVPKQFIELCSKPILMHSVAAFADYDKDIQIVVVLPSAQIDRWRELCRRYDFTVSHQITEGGDNRFRSVRNGLSMISDEGLVAVHDGVRPLVSRQTISSCFREAERYGNAVPTVRMIDAGREVSETGSHPVDRLKLRLIQTPQVFDIKLLKAAYDCDYSPDFTDDASVFERAGHVIRLTEGNPENIKITTQHDLVIARALRETAEK